MECSLITLAAASFVMIQEVKASLATLAGCVVITLKVAHSCLLPRGEQVLHLMSAPVAAVTCRLDESAEEQNSVQLYKWNDEVERFHGSTSVPVTSR